MQCQSIERATNALKTECYLIIPNDGFDVNWNWQKSWGYSARFLAFGLRFFSRRVIILKKTVEELHA